LDSIKAEIISIGNELLSGWTLNTNAHWIAQRCNDIGLPVHWITTIADTEEEIKNTLHLASSRADVVLCTGGLGPTPDDITKNTIASFFNTDLVLDEHTLAHVQKLFKRRNIAMPNINRNQALVPKTAKVIPNSIGTAPGLLFKKSNRLFFFLPGVPKEMKQLIESNILSLIKSFYHLPDFRTFLLRTTGIAESRLFEQIESTLNSYHDIPLSFLPKLTGVDLKLKIDKTNHEKYNRAKQLMIQIRNLVSKHIYSEEEKDLQEVVGDLLRSKNLTLAIAESFTGGLISDWITDIPGSSDYYLGSVVSYSNESKIRELAVAEATLQEFGAVSEQTALEMATGVQNLYGTNCAIATTGIAGPGGATETKPVGLCFLSAIYKNQKFVKKFNFGSNRQMNKQRGSMAALESLRRLLLNI
jgi:nicotinamide-nucleotide amidase